MIYQLREPKFKTPLYLDSIENGTLFPCEDVDKFVIKNLQCPNCEFHIGDKITGANFFQPFICPKCKGVFVFDLRYFQTISGLENEKEKWQKEVGIRK